MTKSMLTPDYENRELSRIADRVLEQVGDLIDEDISLSALIPEHLEDEEADEARDQLEYELLKLVCQELFGQEVKLASEI